MQLCQCLSLLPFETQLQQGHALVPLQCSGHGPWGQQLPERRGGSVTETEVQPNGLLDLHPYNQRRNRRWVSTVLCEHDLAKGGESQSSSALRDC